MLKTRASKGVGNAQKSAPKPSRTSNIFSFFRSTLRSKRGLSAIGQPDNPANLSEASQNGSVTDEQPFQNSSPFNHLHVGGVLPQGELKVDDISAIDLKACSQNTPTRSDPQVLC